jgi:hypothetical protein
MTRAALLIPLLAALGCRGTPPPKPMNADSSIVAGRAWVEEIRRDMPPGNTRTRAADGIIFARVQDGVDLTRVDSKNIFWSQYVDGSLCYLFNMPPGRYVMVGCWADSAGKSMVTYFDAELIRKTMVTLGPRTMGYCGYVRTRASVNSKKADKTQLHYFRNADPKTYARSTLGRMVSKHDAQFATSHEYTRDAKSIAYFRDHAARLFKGTSWAERELRTK